MTGVRLDSKVDDSVLGNALANSSAFLTVFAHSPQPVVLLRWVLGRPFGNGLQGVAHAAPGPHGLPVMALVRRFFVLLTFRVLFSHCCAQVWGDSASLDRLCASKFQSSFRRMFIFRPHVRFDGELSCHSRGFRALTVHSLPHTTGIYLLETTYRKTLERDLLHPQARVVDVSHAHAAMP